MFLINSCNLIGIKKPKPDYFSNNFDTSLTSFYDKFTGNRLDPTKWGHYTSAGFPDIKPGYGDESYHPENVSVRNGMLVISLKKENKFNSNHEVDDLWVAE